MFCRKKHKMLQLLFISPNFNSSNLASRLVSPQWVQACAHGHTVVGWARGTCGGWCGQSQAAPNPENENHQAALWVSTHLEIVMNPHKFPTISCLSNYNQLNFQFSPTKPGWCVFVAFFKAWHKKNVSCFFSLHWLLRQNADKMQEHVWALALEPAPSHSSQGARNVAKTVGISPF